MRIVFAIMHVKSFSNLKLNS